MGFFFFSPKWILWCEKVGMACADKADTKRPDQLSFAPSMARRPSSPLTCLCLQHCIAAHFQVAAPSTRSLVSLVVLLQANCTVSVTRSFVCLFVSCAHAFVPSTHQLTNLHHTASKEGN
jgi:hypothetical protein